MKRVIHSDFVFDCLTVAFFAASYMHTYRFASLVLWFSVGLILFLTVLSNNMKVVLSVGPFHVFALAFTLFCYLSAQWARDAGQTYFAASPIFKTVLAMYVLYLYYQNKPLERLFKAAAIGGYAACLIIMLDQGISTYLIAIRLGLRVYDETYINANMMGIVAACSLTINAYFIIYDKKLYWWTLLAVPALISLMGAVSRNSFIFLGVSILLMFVLRNFNNRKVMLSLARVALVIVAFGILLSFLLRLPAFATIAKRMEDMLMFFRTGNRQVEASVNERSEMIRMGWETFLRHPVLGVGINNSQFYNVRQVYYHNNYIEMLACGGIVGFILYYLMYAYLLRNLWKYRRFRTKEWDLCLTLILASLIREIAAVTYSLKSSYFLLMIFFLEVTRIKKMARQAGLYGAKTRTGIELLNGGHDETLSAF